MSAQAAAPTHGGHELRQKDESKTLSSATIFLRAGPCRGVTLGEIRALVAFMGGLGHIRRPQAETAGTRKDAGVARPQTFINAYSSTGFCGLFV
jgi:hypothetical protein